MTTRLGPRHTAAALLALAAGVHLGAAPGEPPLDLAGLLAIGVLQAGTALALLGRPSRAVTGVAAITNSAIAGLWIVTHHQAPDVAGVLATAAALAAVAVLLLPLRRPRASAPVPLPRRAVLAAPLLAAFALLTAVPGLAHDHADHGHFTLPPPDSFADGLDFRRSPDSPLDGAVVPVGQGPVDVVADGDTLWVTDGAGGTVRRVDRHTGSPVGTPLHVGGAPTAALVAFDALWVADAEGAVLRIDTERGAVTSRTPVGRVATDLAATADAVWVTSGFDGTVTALDPATGEVDGEPVRTTVGLAAVNSGGPSALAVADGLLWVVNTLDREVVAVDPVTRMLTGEPLRVGAGPRAIAVADGLLWVANATDGTLSRIDPTVPAVIGDPVIVDAHPQLAGGPVALAAGPDGLWVANSDERTVLLVDPATATVSAGPLFASNFHSQVPRRAGLVVTSDAVWLTDYDAAALVRFPT